LWWKWREWRCWIVKTMIKNLRKDKYEQDVSESYRFVICWLGGGGGVVELRAEDLVARCIVLSVEQVVCLSEETWWCFTGWRGPMSELLHASWIHCLILRNIDIQSVSGSQENNLLQLRINRDWLRTEYQSLISSSVYQNVSAYSQKPYLTLWNADVTRYKYSNWQTSVRFEVLWRWLCIRRNWEARGDIKACLVLFVFTVGYVCMYLGRHFMCPGNAGASTLCWGWILWFRIASVGFQNLLR
jgi:hypothetical protein